MKKEFQAFMLVTTFLLGSLANSSCAITSKLFSIRREAENSDAVQGAWPDGKEHPYEDNPFYIIANAFILIDPLEPMTFKDTNQKISQVAWQSPMGVWYKTDISNLRTI